MESVILQRKMIFKGAFWLVSLIWFLTITLPSSSAVNYTHSHVDSGRTDLFELSIIHLNDFHAR